MTRKEFVQSQLDFLNSMMSGVVMGGLIGLIILIVQFFQSSTPVNVPFLCIFLVALLVLGVVGWQVNSYRYKFLKELSDMPP
jgi:type III secretory pathway component EscS